MTRDKLIKNIAWAISLMEGFHEEGSVARKHNNPGNLRTWGKHPVVGGFVQFPTVADGWTALERQVGRNIDRGLNLLEFFGGKPGVYAGYAPAADKNNPDKYAKFVAGRVGVEVDKKLLDVIEEDGNV